MNGPASTPRTPRTAHHHHHHHHHSGDSEGGVGAEAAIYVRNACKSYGVGKRRATVLRNLDMTVKKGHM